MGLTVTSVMPMHAILMVAEDENQEKQVFLRVSDYHDPGKGAIIQGNLTGPHMRKLDQEESIKYDEILLDQAEKHMAKRLGPELVQAVKDAIEKFTKGTAAENG